MNPTQSGTGFLSFNSLPPRLWITSEDEEFDETTIKHWKDEGYDVTYLPMGSGGKAYVNELRSLSDDLGSMIRAILLRLKLIVQYRTGGGICISRIRGSSSSRS